MMPIIDVVDSVVFGQEQDQDHAGKAHRDRKHDDEGVDQRFELGGHDHVHEHQRQDGGKHAGPQKVSRCC